MLPPFNLKSLAAPAAWKPEPLVDSGATPPTIAERVRAVRNASYHVALKLTVDYIQGKEMFGQALSYYTAERIFTANETIEETRKALSLGRANFKQDADRAWNACMVGRYISNLGTEKKDENDEIASVVASAEAVKSGMCGENSVTTYYNYLPKLREGDRLFIEGSSTPKHRWVRLETKLGDNIIMDSWTHGGAVLQEDYKYQKNKSFEREITLSREGIQQRVRKYRDFVSKLLTPNYRDFISKEMVERHSIIDSLLFDGNDQHSESDEFRMKIERMRPSIFQMKLEKIQLMVTLGSSMKQAIAAVKQEERDEQKIS